MEPQEQVELVLNRQGENFIIVVDLETANELLNDPLKADQFIENQIRAASAQEAATSGGTSTAMNDDQPLPEPLPGPSWQNDATTAVRAEGTTENIKIWSQKRPTPMDLEATELFLKLRLKYSKKFDDRKTVKAQIWQKIADELKDMGYNVGQGKEAIEKLRLKFSNLQKQYFLHLKHMNSTGQSQRDPPPFFELIHDILGHKDKSNPSDLQDTIRFEDTEQENMNNPQEAVNIDETPAFEENSNKESTRDTIKNRFKKPTASQGLKPKSANMQLLEVARSDSQERKSHMKKIESILETQNEQRERLIGRIDRWIELKSRKRKREMSSFDSD